MGGQEFDGRFNLDLVDDFGFAKRRGDICIPQ